MMILIVITSHDQLGDTGKKTGFWLEEFAAVQAARNLPEDWVENVQSLAAGE